MAHDWFAVSQEGVVHVLALAVPFQVDSSDFDRLHEGILSAIGLKANAKWVIDLAGLQYLGSSVLGLMVNIRQQPRKTVRDPSRPPRRGGDAHEVEPSDNKGVRRRTR
jgi:hypothetical protein